MPSKAEELATSGKRSLQRPLTRWFPPPDARKHRRSSDLTNRFIIVADYRKNSEYLGTNVNFLTLAYHHKRQEADRSRTVEGWGSRGGGAVRLCESSKELGSPGIPEPYAQDG